MFIEHVLHLHRTCSSCSYCFSTVIALSAAFRVPCHGSIGDERGQGCRREGGGWERAEGPQQIGGGQGLRAKSGKQDSGRENERQREGEDGDTQIDKHIQRPQRSKFEVRETHEKRAESREGHGERRGRGYGFILEVESLQRREGGWRSEGRGAPSSVVWVHGSWQSRRYLQASACASARARVE